MSVETKPIKQKIMNEVALALMLVFAGMVLLPLSIYLTGQSIFGEYGGAGFTDFFGRLSGKLRDGRSVVWFLVLSPYLIVMLLRFTLWAFLRARRTA